VDRRNPLFVDAAQGNFRLQSSSPAINAGLPDIALQYAADLDGYSRVLLQDFSLGCYAYRPLP
jgi:hypothetical protein